MEITKEKFFGEYRLVYFSPDPEDGERLCVGLLITSGINDHELVYDKKFTRVHCLSTSVNSNLLEFYLSSLKEAIRSKSESLDLILRGIGSQISFSESRGLLMPITADLKIRLLERFVIHGSGVNKPAQPEAGLRINPVADSIERLAKRIELPSDSRIMRNASSKQILGHKVRNIRPVSIVIERRNRFFLIDGVDLNFMSPNEAIKKTNDVVHTFWQYERLRSQELLGRNLNRVGVLFNGIPQKTSSYEDAHDFALHLLGKEADVMIDASSPEDEQRLSHLIKG